MRRWTSGLVAVTAFAALAACTPTSSPPEPVETPRPAGLTWLRATRGDRAAIFDAHGRQVVLRGVNANHLGDYFSSDPRLPTVSTLDDTDWAQMAAQGMNVVRLVTSWSSWQPTRGSFDVDYLARVREAVDGARRHGIHTVIDMHQDAWSRHVFTPADEMCTSVTRHQIGWDGAPQWATITDGRSTCTPGSREDSPAVRRAWDSFYTDRDGIRSELARLWGRIATEFANEPAVAGYDLLNEPGTANDIDTTVIGLTAFTRHAIDEIRAAERAAGAPEGGHIVFFEWSVHGAWPSFDLHPDTNLVFAPHNYAESIGPRIPGLMDAMFALQRLLGSIYRTPVWIGEYGFFGSAAENAVGMERFAALDDELVGEGGAGGAWWQWEQECGDPHDVGPAYPPTEQWVLERVPTCGRDGGELHCTARPYPRAAPGRLTSVRTGSGSNRCAGELTVAGSVPIAGDADVWFPSDSATAPTVGGIGVLDHETSRVDGGWRLTVRVVGDYRIVVTG